jgi:hypothetical protein
MQTSGNMTGPYLQVSMNSISHFHFLYFFVMNTQGFELPLS